MRGDRLGKSRLIRINCCTDTDFTARPVDVYPDGTAYNLSDGIVQVSYACGRNGQDNLKNKIKKYEIDLWAISNVFLPGQGHKFRIGITSSNYPWYNVNPNIGKTTLDTTEMVKANQMILHDSGLHSYVVLIPGKS
ncbi:CocE/NonD family hydrolase C-terminal non-catalytic domain-containing protein [Virgibacillus byunsanensis]|uniref:CocE/NonD family hydrolase C-terminal non-catalytic domain-containing protein n=1 Tax=Virgibacillus byunsanensis TaxID=570945 RepID=A0ABW3LLV7_9BACI